MLSTLRADLFKLRHSRGLYFSLFVGLIICIINLIITINEQHHSIEMLNKYENLKYIYYPITVSNSALGINNYAYTTSIFFTILPIIATLPFGLSLFTEKKKGYINFCLTRTKSSHYYISKIIVSYIGGSLICGAVLVFSIILNSAFVPSAQPEVISALFPVAYEKTYFLDLYLNHPVVFMLLYTMIDMLYAGWLAVLSVLATFIFDYRITVLIFPLAIYLLFSYFSRSIGIEIGILHSLLPQYNLSAYPLGNIMIELLILNLITLILIAVMVKKDNKC